MTKLLLLMLTFSLTILGNNAMNEARGLTNQKVLAANYARDNQQKLFVITNQGAYLYIKNGSSFSKFFAKTFKSNETVLFRSAGLKDINNDGSLDLWYATKSNNKKTLYVVNTRPKRGKYSFYLVALKNNGSILKSGNLRKNSGFHRWMYQKVKHLNENTTIINQTQKRPPLQNIVNDAKKIAEGLIDGKILKAGFYKNNNGSRFLYAVTTSDAYLFIQTGNSYSKFFNKKLKSRYQLVLNNVGIYDVKGNGFGDFYYMVKNNTSDKILSLVNTKPRQGKYSFYLLQRRRNGSLTKSGNLRKNSLFYKWMKKKIGDNHLVIIQKPIDNKPKLSGDYIYLCDISTNGKGGYRTGGTYCGISINDFKGYEIVFQQVYGKVNYIAAHERFRNGNWKLTYKGAMRNLRLRDVRKTNRSTHINFSVNGANENYDKSITKVRVYKKALTQNMPSVQEATTIFNSKIRLRRNESIIKVFIYKENSQMKITVLTTNNIYTLINQDYGNWNIDLNHRLKLRKVKMNNNFNGMEDVENDSLRDIYYTTIDRRKGYNLLNLYSVKTNRTYTAYAKIGEAIGDFEPEVEFKFTRNTPKNLKPWFKRMIFRFGFVKKPKEISEDNPKDALKLWIRDNGFLGRRELQLRLRMYNGDQDSNFVSKGTHPVIAKVTLNNIVYRSHYRGIVTAFNKNTNKSYILYVSKLKRSFVSAFGYSNNKIFLGTQNDGIIIFDKNNNTLKIFRNRKLKNKDIWKIIKKGNYYLIFTDSERAVMIKARKLER